jgi:hypothetical protein
MVRNRGKEIGQGLQLPLRSSVNDLGEREDGRSLYSHKEIAKEHGQPQTNKTAARAGDVQGLKKQGNVVIVAVRRRTRPRDLRNQVGKSRDKLAAPSDGLVVKHRVSKRNPGKDGTSPGRIRRVA